MSELGFFVSRTRIAYLCMEIALRPMKQSISKFATYSNSQRMMRRYATEAYIR